MKSRSTMYTYWEEYNNSSETQSYTDLVIPTGISYPVIITEIIGNVSVGDELVAYADGQVVGATRIADLSDPVVISAWGGYHNLGVDLEGYAVGDAIDLRLYSQEEAKEMKVEINVVTLRKKFILKSNKIIKSTTICNKNYTILSVYQSRYLNLLLFHD